jgi:Ca2+/Na+ antiporter
MNSGETWGLIGGIAGGILGLLGGIVGAYFSIKNTNSQPERAFVIKCSVVCFIAVSVFCALMFTLPSPYRYLLWIPYSILLPWGIMVLNRKQQRIRETETYQAAPSNDG